jgi:serine/threonine-protein kinase SRPK3
MIAKNACAKFQYAVTPTGPKIVPVNPAASPKDEESPTDCNSRGYFLVKLGDASQDGRYVILRNMGALSLLLPVPSD